MKNFSLFSALTSLTLLNTVAINLPASAQNQKNSQSCNNIEAFAEEPSKTTKTIKLEKFGIKIKIPSNYRTMLLNDGSVNIVDPYTFHALRCKAQHGVYTFNIDLLDNPKNLSLEQLARFKYSMYNDGLFNIYNYSENGIIGKVVEFKNGGSSAYALFNVPGVDKVVEMSAGCDCTVDRRDVIKYLKVTQPINKSTSSSLPIKLHSITIA